MPWRRLRGHPSCQRTRRGSICWQCRIGILLHRASCGAHQEASLYYLHMLSMAGFVHHGLVSFKHALNSLHCADRTLRRAWLGPASACAVGSDLQMHMTSAIALMHNTPGRTGPTELITRAISAGMKGWWDKPPAQRRICLTEGLKEKPNDKLQRHNTPTSNTHIKTGCALWEQSQDVPLLPGSLLENCETECTWSCFRSAHTTPDAKFLPVTPEMPKKLAGQFLLIQHTHQRQVLRRWRLPRTYTCLACSSAGSALAKGEDSFQNTYLQRFQKHILTTHSQCTHALARPGLTTCPATTAAKDTKLSCTLPSAHTSTATALTSCCQATESMPLEMASETPCACHAPAA